MRTLPRQGHSARTWRKSVVVIPHSLRSPEKLRIYQVDEFTWTVPCRKRGDRHVYADRLDRKQFAVRKSRRVADVQALNRKPHARQNLSTQSSNRDFAAGCLRDGCGNVVSIAIDVQKVRYCESDQKQHDDGSP